jgi:hypothetical protein
MKKLFLFLFIGLVIVDGYGQKKESSNKKDFEISSFPKLGNLQAEVKNGNFQIAITGKEKTNDVVIVKAVNTTFSPTNCKLSSFTASGVKLYLLTWSEQSAIKTDRLVENKTTVYSVVYEIVSKKQVYSNYQLTINSIEKVFLDKNKTASETQQKIRREGFEFILNTDGSITQKGKNNQMIFVYDKSKIEFKKK